jgi:hypothetical protein
MMRTAMSVNKYRPHLMVLPEDDANSHIANGFLLDPNVNDVAIQVLPVAGGWTHVEDEFLNVHVQMMRCLAHRRMVLLIDFDGQYQDRFTRLKGEIPAELDSRVFVLGSLTKPEDLKKEIKKNLEEIGKALSRECFEGTRTVWGHPLLKDNDAELKRMESSVRPFLFRGQG